MNTLNNYTGLEISKMLDAHGGAIVTVTLILLIAKGAKIAATKIVDSFW